MNRHSWTEQDDIVALYFCKFSDLGRTSSLAIVGERRGMGAGSLRMRVGNFAAIAGGGRLDHAALQSREIYSTVRWLVRTRTAQACRFVTVTPKKRTIGSEQRERLSHQA